MPGHSEEISSTVHEVEGLLKGNLAAAQYHYLPVRRFKTPLVLKRSLQKRASPNSDSVLTFRNLQVYALYIIREPKFSTSSVRERLNLIRPPRTTFGAKSGVHIKDEGI